jgi:hypothetical protein
VQIVVWTITSDADEFALAFAAKAKKALPEGRDRSAQREDQLQGAGALTGEDCRRICGRLDKKGQPDSEP